MGNLLISFLVYIMRIELKGLLSLYCLHDEIDNDPSSCSDNFRCL